MNKNDISKRVYEAHGGLSYVEAQQVVDLVLEIIKKRLVRGEKVLLSGFGCFTVMTRRDKRGVNPQSGEPIEIPGRKSVRFRPSKYLKSLDSDEIRSEEALL
jgi:nucleoid DNA-binding protein